MSNLKQPTSGKPRNVEVFGYVGGTYDLRIGAEKVAVLSGEELTRLVNAAMIYMRVVDLND